MKPTQPPLPSNYRPSVHQTDPYYALGYPSMYRVYPYNQYTPQRQPEDLHWHLNRRFHRLYDPASGPQSYPQPYAFRPPAQPQTMMGGYPYLPPQSYSAGADFGGVDAWAGYEGRMEEEDQRDMKRVKRQQMEGEPLDASSQSQVGPQFLNSFHPFVYPATSDAAVATTSASTSLDTIINSTTAINTTATNATTNHHATGSASDTAGSSSDSCSSTFIERRKKRKISTTSNPISSQAYKERVDEKKRTWFQSWCRNHPTYSQLPLSEQDLVTGEKVHEFILEELIPKRYQKNYFTLAAFSVWTAVLNKLYEEQAQAGLNTSEHPKSHPLIKKFHAQLNTFRKMQNDEMVSRLLASIPSSAEEETKVTDGDNQVPAKLVSLRPRRSCSRGDVKTTKIVANETFEATHEKSQEGVKPQERVVSKPKKAEKDRRQRRASASAERPMSEWTRVVGHGLNCGAVPFPVPQAIAEEYPLLEPMGVVNEEVLPVIATAEKDLVEAPSAVKDLIEVPSTEKSLVEAPSAEKDLVEEPLAEKGFMKAERTLLLKRRVTFSDYFHDPIHLVSESHMVVKDTEIDVVDVDPAWEKVEEVEMSEKGNVVVTIAENEKGDAIDYEKQDEVTVIEEKFEIVSPETACTTEEERVSVTVTTEERDDVMITEVVHEDARQTCLLTDSSVSKCAGGTLHNRSVQKVVPDDEQEQRSIDRIPDNELAVEAIQGNEEESIETVERIGDNEEQQTFKREQSPITPSLPSPMDGLDSISDDMTAPSPETHRHKHSLLTLTPPPLPIVPSRAEQTWMAFMQKQQDLFQEHLIIQQQQHKEMISMTAHVAALVQYVHQLVTDEGGKKKN